MEHSWYVLHTYSGYENKVKDNLEKLIESQEIPNSIFKIVIPTEEIIEKTDSDKVRTTSRKLYPGYVFVNMLMSDEIWYRIRNIRGVTGFVGPTGKEAVPLNEEEIVSMGIKDVFCAIEYRKDETVMIKKGPLKGKYAIVRDFDIEKKIVKAVVDIMGESIIELESSYIEKIK